MSHELEQASINIEVTDTNLKGSKWLYPRWYLFFRSNQKRYLCFRRNQKRCCEEADVGWKPPSVTQYLFCFFSGQFVYLIWFDLIWFDLIWSPFHTLSLWMLLWYHWQWFPSDINSHASSPLSPTLLSKLANCTEVASNNRRSQIASDFTNLSINTKNIYIYHYNDFTPL